jgi:Uma2 family endonuclease
MPETVRRMELLHGVVREPPAPKYGHQSLITHLTALLDVHVRSRGLGQVCVSPVDVVLDEEDALVVQPDIIFIRKERLHIVRARVWGAPDLVVEVLSFGTTRYDRTTKLGWYRKYGVQEEWIIDTQTGSIEVVALQTDPPNRETFTADDPIRSRVLPDWDFSAEQIFI